MSRPATPPPLPRLACVLLQHQETLDPGRGKSLLVLPFQVPAGLAGLRIYMDYRPRSSSCRARNDRLVAGAVQEQLGQAAAAGLELSPKEQRHLSARPELQPLRGRMRNLLNLTLRDPSGSHRGRWDQNLSDVPEEDVICGTWASPGYLAGPVGAGTWTATLEVHEVVSESCQVLLRLAGLPRSPRRPRKAPRPPALSVGGAQEEYKGRLPAGWLRGELHCHSRASDGELDPMALARRARAMGLDFLALTDHNTTSGLASLHEAPLCVIPGCEITTFLGHFLALGVARAPKWYRGQQLVSLAELSTQVRQAGGLFGLAHPFVLGNPVCAGCRMAVQVVPGEVDLVEVWSRGGIDPLADRHALALVSRMWAAGSRVTAVAGRDWHNASQERAGAGGRRFPATVVWARPEPGSILEALRLGACYLSTGPLVDLCLRWRGGEVSLESPGPPRDRPGTGRPASLGPVTALARLEGIEQAAWLRLLSGGRVVKELAVGPGAAELVLPGVPPGPGGVRLELWPSGEAGTATSPLLLTNPLHLPL